MNNEQECTHLVGRAEYKDRKLLGIRCNACGVLRLAPNQKKQHIFDTLKEGCIKCGGFMDDPCEPPKQFDYQPKPSMS